MVLAAFGGAAGAKRGRGVSPTLSPISRSVFYLGHSLQNFDIPTMVEDIATSQGNGNSWAAKIGIGAGLRFQYENPTLGEGWPTDPMNTLTHMGSVPYDATIITEAQPLQDQILNNDPVLYAGNFYDLAVGANASCQVYLYSHWPSKSVGNAAWRAQLDTDEAGWVMINQNVNAGAGRESFQPMLVLPGHKAMAALYDAFDGGGGVPGYTSIDEFFTDDIHLTDPGNYFMACVQYAMVYRRTPVGATSATTDRFAGAHTPPPAEAVETLQSIAWTVVSDWLEAGAGA